MKKAISLLLVLVMVLALAACGSSASSTTASSSSAASTGTGTTASSSGSSANVVTENKEATDAQIAEQKAAGLASGALTGLTTATEEGLAITAEGKSENVHITIANANDISATDPYSGGRNDTKYLLYDNLAVMHYPGGDVDSMDWVIAKNITKIDDDTYQIEIYDYVHDWQDNPITASDVVWSYQAYIDSGKSGKVASHLDYFEIVDDYTVIMHLKNNALGMIQYMLQQTPICSQKGYEAQTEAEHSQNPLSTGPYRITEYVAGGYVVLTRNDNYWQTDSSKWSYMYSGQIEEVRYVIMTENSQRAIALQNGSVDVVPLMAAEDIGNFMDGDGNALEGYNVLKCLNSAVNFFVFNCSETSVCSDINFRLAVTYATDRAGIMDGTFGKNAWLATNETATSTVGDYNDDWTWYDYDFDLAKEYLAKSSYSGETLHLICESNRNYQTMLELLQAYLSAIGVDSVIDPYDSALISDKKKDPASWDILVENSGSSDYCLDTWNLVFDLSTTTNLNECLVEDTELWDLCVAAGGLDTHSRETVDAVHDYNYANVLTMPLGTYYKYSVATDKLLVWPLHPFNYCAYGGFIFE